MASFSIRLLKNDDDYAKAFSGILVEGPQKDYNKDVFRVKYNSSSGEQSYLSLKFPTLTIVTVPQEGKKYFYAKLESAKDVSVAESFDALDTYISSKMPDEYVSKMQATFKNIDKGVVKIYIPHKAGKLRSDKLKIYDCDKNQQDVSCIKEGSKIKLLAYLKQLKRYRDEIVPMWIAEQIQIIKTDSKIDLESKIDSDLKIEENKEVLEDHMELGSDRKDKCDLSEESSNSDDISDDDYEAPW